MKNKIFFAIFMLVWLFLIILNFMLPKETFSVEENRMLAKVPKFTIESLINGEYAQKLDDYINDHFIFRNFFVELKNKVEIAIGKQEIEGIYVCKDEYLIEKYTNTDYENIAKIIKKVNDFKIENPNTDITMLIAPNSIEINKERLPKNAINNSQTEVIRSIYKKLKGIRTIDVIEALKRANEIDETYFRLDHHWNTLGAYIAYRQYCKDMGINALNINDFNIETVSTEFRGTNYSKILNKDYTPDTMEVFIPKDEPKVKVRYWEDSVTEKINEGLYFEENLNIKDKYTYYLGNNPPILVIENESIEENELLVLKDSFANIFIPFLANHYSKIHVIDLRYYNTPISEYIKEEDISNILILYNLLTMENDIGILKLR